MRTSRPRGAHFFPWSLRHPANRLAQPPTPLLRNTASFVAQGSIFCCATKSAPPPNLRISKSPRYENISRLSDHILSSARTTHNTIIPTKHTTHSRHDCGPAHEPSGPEGILKPLSNSSLNFSHLVIITFYHNQPSFLF